VLQIGGICQHTRDITAQFPDGRIGSNPGLATPEAGRRLYDAAVAAIAKDYLGWVGG